MASVHGVGGDKAMQACLGTIANPPSASCGTPSNGGPAHLPASCTRKPKVGCLLRRGATRISHSWSALILHVISLTCSPVRLGSPGGGTDGGSAPARRSMPLLVVRLRVWRCSSSRTSPSK